MSRRAQENLVAFIMLFFLIAIIIISLDYSPRARLVPIPIAATSALIVLTQLYLMNFRRDINLNVDPTELLTRGKSKESIEEGKTHDQVEEVKIQKLEGGREITAVLIVLVYFLLTLLIGIMPAMFLFIIGFYLFITKLNWMWSLLISFLTLVGIYILFVRILEIQFFEGWLVNLILG